MTGVALLNPPMTPCRNRIMNRIAAFRYTVAHFASSGE